MFHALASMDAATLLTFLSAGVLLNLTPGADVLFASATGLSGGPRAGIAAAGGVALGGLAHTVLAALGVAALIQAAPMAYRALLWAGAAYLLWLAIRSWNAPPPEADPRGATSLHAAVRRGFLTNILNPKVALFVLAFLPQFTDPARGPVAPQILTLGVIFSLTGFAITAGYGAAAGLLRHRLARFHRGLTRASSLVFAGLAARLIWTS